MAPLLDDDDMPHGEHNPKVRSSSSNYHPPNPPSSPLVSSSQSPMDIDTPLPPSDQTIKTLDRISSLELALCSNFTCCSIKLPDLHALVEHFEEKHVVAINIDGKRIYPENTSGKRLAVFPPMPPSLSNSPSSSRSSSPPTPTIPLATASFLNSDQGSSAKKLSLATESGGVYTPFSGMLMFPPPDEEDPYGLFDSLDTYPVISTSPPSYTSDFPSHAQASCSSSSSPTMNPRSHDPMILNPDCHSDVIITVHDLDFNLEGEEGRKKKSTTTTKKDIITDREVKKVVHRAKVDNAVLNMTAVSAKNAAKTKMRLLGGNNVKRREKAYRCPKAGCTKSYLNPNGLKYHLEKGTCHIEIDSNSESYTTSDSSSIPPTTTNPTHPSTTTTTIPSIELSTSTTTQTPSSLSLSSSSPYPLPFLKIENYISAMQRNRTPIITPSSSMIPTPPATPGSESPNCETNLPLPGITGHGPGGVYHRAPTSSPSTTIPSISLPVPVSPTPMTPTSKSMLLPTTMTISHMQPMSP